MCGSEGIRTLDLLNAIETRSQLRHGPIQTTNLLSYVDFVGRSASLPREPPRVNVQSGRGNIQSTAFRKLRDKI